VIALKKKFKIFEDIPIKYNHSLIINPTIKAIKMANTGTGKKKIKPSKIGNKIMAVSNLYFSIMGI
jgi:hypothetical protein